MFKIKLTEFNNIKKCRGVQQDRDTDAYPRKLRHPGEGVPQSTLPTSPRWIYMKRRLSDVSFSLSKTLTKSGGNLCNRSIYSFLYGLLKFVPFSVSH